jgi:hypothetical protein
MRLDPAQATDPLFDAVPPEPDERAVNDHERPSGSPQRLAQAGLLGREQPDGLSDPASGGRLRDSEAD